MIFKIKCINKLLIFMIFISILLSGFTNADDEKLNDSDDFEYDKDLRLPDYGPELFEKAKNSPKFIAARGTMPEIGKREEEKREWINLLVKCSSFSNLSIDPYMTENGGPVVLFGCRGLAGENYSEGGYLVVEFDKQTPEKVNESLIDEMYQLIEDHCAQEGISEVPVIFMWGEMLIECEGTEIVEETANLPASNGENTLKLNYSNNNNSEPDNSNSSTENESSKNNSTPGFGLLGSLTCLYAVWNLRTK